MASSPLLSRLDLSVRENVRDLRHEYRAAGNDPAKLAVWAAKWGEGVISRLEATSTKELGGLQHSDRVRN